MSLRHSISQWIAAWRAGDQRAADHLWHRYYQRAAQLARRRVRALPHGEEEDVAAQALHSLLRRTARGSYAQLCSREDFWRLLMTITRRKAIDQYRRAVKHKRVGTSTPLAHSTAAAAPPDTWADRAESPAALASYKETLEQMLSRVDDQLRAIIQYKMAGYTNLEIAAHVNCSVPTVERRLRLIRQLWIQEASPCRPE